MGQATTIKLSLKTKERLERLRAYRRETYDEILEKILGILNICRSNPEMARAKLKEIDKTAINRRKSKSL